VAARGFMVPGTNNHVAQLVASPFRLWPHWLFTILGVYENIKTICNRV